MNWLGAFSLLSALFLGSVALSGPRGPDDFSFDAAGGLSNRVLTPNGDAKNDFVVFTFANPRDSAISGRILDLHGKHVSGMSAGPAANTLSWDGRAAGKTVAAGIYIYVLSGEGRVYSGAVVVIR